MSLQYRDHVLLPIIFTSKDRGLEKLSNDYAHWNHLEREHRGIIDRMNSPYIEVDSQHNSEL